MSWKVDSCGFDSGSLLWVLIMDFSMMVMPLNVEDRQLTLVPGSAINVLCHLTT